MRQASTQLLKKRRCAGLAWSTGKDPTWFPLSFGYRENTLYFHGALKGRKIDILKENPNVCVEFDVAVEAQKDVDACNWSMKFQSVIGFGKASIVEGLELKRQALGIIMAQYSDKTFAFPENKLNATAVIKVEIEKMTGKQSGY